MNCVQFERGLPDYLEGTHTSEHQTHLSSCPSCSGLLADLNFISSEAASLQTLDEPSPRVWTQLEANLRREGLIRQPAIARPAFTDIFSRWRNAWLIPVAAALIVAAGIKLYHPTKAGDNAPIAKQTVPAKPAARKPAAIAVSDEDRDILSRVASRPPAQQASYRADLDSANSFIRDAEASVKSDPNDVYMQQMLVDAYQQKQMLYDLAVDRSLGEQ
jgi:hypothetical protein